MKYLYRLFFAMIPVILKLAGIFSPKVRHFLQGRKDSIEKVRRFRIASPEKLVWIHVASLGEYEQARPVIGALKRERPDWKVAVTFFSPSGFDHVSKRPQPQVDFVGYIPLDQQSKARQFVAVMNPDLVFFVKYDLWYHHIEELYRKKIPMYLIAAVFRSEQVYFQSYGKFFQEMLNRLNWVFTQDQKSIALLQKIGIEHASQAGDTRFDRVAATASAPKSLPEINSWVQDYPVVVVGSAWQEDMDILISLINSKPGYRWIIAPHDLHPEPMERWSAAISWKSERYSEGKFSADAQVLFIDNIGMLSSLYQFAKVAYIGGAFGKGLHNILEAIGFGIPVIFGKVKKAGKFPEALQSQQQGCGFEVKDEAELKAIFDQLENEEPYQKAVKSAKNWVEMNLGAADRIINKVLSRNSNL